MTSEEEALLRVLQALARTGIPHMVTGSMASSFHGRPRFTHDADIVIDPTASQLDTLVPDLEAEGFLVDGDRARDALRRRLQFNAIEMATAFKIDLIICKDRPFSREELGRRRPGEISPGTSVAIASPEDVILSKLEWAKRGGSKMQVQDAAGVLAVNPGIDRVYVARWADELGVLELWEQIERGEAPPG